MYGMAAGAFFWGYVLFEVPSNMILEKLGARLWIARIVVGCGWLSDRLGERRWSLFWTCLVATAGLVFAGLTLGSWWSIAGMSLAAIGFYGSKGPFWSMPTMLLTGTAAASGIAWINSLGNLGGFFGPSMVGWAKHLTGSFAGGLYALAACSLASAVIALLWLDIQRRRASAAAPGLAE